MYPPSEIVNTVASAAGIKTPVIPYKNIQGSLLSCPQCSKAQKLLLIEIRIKAIEPGTNNTYLLYTSDAADDMQCVDLGGRRVIKKKKNKRKVRVQNNITNNMREQEQSTAT
eukprot:TRINITY_DN10753_c0_g1_i3.p3 TRINITY_DN10753_c0_g1~~TRINITY_DN10753_c0_g1_i3.p3  ORF type:complete len:112 (-),score=12.17 TRINITY_DN10753_c0_g1_i3:46-381(-)